VEWAVAALVGGLDSPSLRELAGVSDRDDPRLAGELLSGVAEELGVGLPTLAQAGWRLIALACERFLSEALDPQQLSEAVLSLARQAGLRTEEQILDFEWLSFRLGKLPNLEEEQQARWEFDQAVWVLRADARRLCSLTTPEDDVG
jgi:hypothetical protein